MHVSIFQRLDDFDLSSFNFNQPLEKTDILEFVGERQFFQRDVVKNFHYLFSNVPVLNFEDSSRITCEVDEVYNKVGVKLLWTEEPGAWSCHIAAPYYTIHKPEYTCVFGFARQILSNPYWTNTFLHSFNAKQNEFIDLTLQVRIDQEKYWINNNKLDKFSIAPENVVSYMGIVIPKNILNDILYARNEEGITGNLWGYIKNKVLCSQEKTTKFIEVLNNNGAGWQYEK